MHCYIKKRKYNNSSHFGFSRNGILVDLIDWNQIQQLIERKISQFRTIILENCLGNAEDPLELCGCKFRVNLCGMVIDSPLQHPSHLPLKCKKRRDRELHLMRVVGFSGNSSQESGKDV